MDSFDRIELAFSTGAGAAEEPGLDERGHAQSGFQRVFRCCCTVKQPLCVAATTRIIEARTCSLVLENESHGFRVAQRRSMLVSCAKS